MEKDEISIALNGAFQKLLERDIHLLEINANERSISHRFAIYLEPYFAEWDVDCEYNRNHDDIKRLRLEQRIPSDDDLDAVTVFPDIIVHRRSTDENLLVIEMKKSTSSEDDGYDLKKLSAFKKELSYKYAVFMRLRTNAVDPGLDILEFL